MPLTCLSYLAVMCNMRTETSEDGQGSLPLCTESSLTHCFYFDAHWSECQCDFARLVCSAELWRFLPRGHSYLSIIYLPSFAILTNYCWGILIVCSLVQRPFVNSESPCLHTLCASVFVSIHYCASLWFCYCCCYSFRCLKSAGSFPGGFSFSLRRTFMLPAQTDTLEVRSLSRFTDVKPKMKINQTIMFWTVFSWSMNCTQ